jgi:hypothetical protein
MFLTDTAMFLFQQRHFCRINALVRFTQYLQRAALMCPVALPLGLSDRSADRVSR